MEDQKEVLVHPDQLEKWDQKAMVEVLVRQVMMAQKAHQAHQETLD